MRIAGVYIVLYFSLFISCNKGSDNPDVNPPNGGDELKKGLLAYYPFNGNMNDESGNNYNLAGIDVVAASNRFDQPSKAYTFNGTSSKMAIPKFQKADSLRELTISVWVRPDAVNSQRIYQLYGNPDFISCVHTSLFVIINGEPLIYHEIVAEYAPYFCSLADNFDTIDNRVGKWTHIVLIQKYGLGNGDYKQYTYSHYMNGKKLKSDQSKGIYAPNPMPVNFGLGGDIGYGGNSNFSGIIDDMRIYSRALSEEEVQKLYNLQSE